MADVWTRTFKFPAGSTDPQRFEVGPAISMVGYKEGAIVGTLRGGFANGQPAQNFVANFLLPDQGNVMGPIDLPFTFECELPVTIEITPEAAPTAEILVQLAASDGTGCDSTYGALRSVWVEDGNNVTIPQWCQAVSLSDNAAIGEWQDPAAAPIGTFTGNHNPRPRHAATVLVTGDTLVIFHYTS
ncbi:MAG: hypothetical protein JSV86_18455 [Gemmatimonadota bacterium]|nr:MAG: hypothetical protein JSV86_18455 [Gemmatimonadota bacterium]